MKAGDVVLVDTNVILECHGKGCWRPIAGAYRVQTVEKCVEETQTGKFSRPAEQQIDEQALRASLNAVHAVTDAELADVALRGGTGLDDGERALWGHALGRSDAWVLCGPDRASMKFGYDQNQRDRLVSLGGLLRTINTPSPRPLRSHFEQDWLDTVINKLILGIL
jgi:hypothetical protein